MMKQLFFFICAIALWPAAEAAPFSVDASGILKADSLSFRIVCFDKDWKDSAEQGPETVAFPGEAGAEGRRSGIFRTNGGGFKLIQETDFSRRNHAVVSWRLTSDEAVECEGIFLTASFPVGRFLERPLLLNGKPLNFGPEYRADRWRSWGGKRSGDTDLLEIPLAAGTLLVRGTFSAMLQDNRRYKNEEWQLRISFDSPNRAIRNALLALEFEFVPYPMHTVDLREAGNLAFRDEQADDRKGGWPDQGAANDLASLPLGKQTFGGMEFDIIDPAANGGRSCLALRGGQRPWLPETAKADAAGVSGRYLYLLNALGWETPGPTPVGEVVVRYADGTGSRYALRSGEDTANFWNPRSLKHGFSVWKGENPSSEIGLYATRIALDGKPLKELSFHSAGNAVWLIVAATVTDAFFEAETRPPVIMEANGLWMPIGNPKPVASGSILDFSELADRPAGKYGPVRTNGETLEFANRPGVPLRFWGINLCADCNFPSREQAPKLMDELVMAGYNLVRFHQFDHLLADRSGGGSTALDAKRLDRFDNFFACGKERGLYVSLDLFTFRATEPGEIPEFPGRAISGHELKALIFINENAMRNWETFCANLLNHVNPYTGLAWKEDPAVVNYCLINEDTLSQTSTRTAFIREQYEKKFQAYLAERGIAAEEKNRSVLYAKFLQDVYRKGYARMSAFVRSVGGCAPITDLNYINDNSTTVLRENLDLVDAHGYWAHPQFIGANWRLPAATDPGCPVRAYGGIASPLFSCRIFGKPSAISEWDYTFPNPFGSAGSFLAGAYGALQGHSMLCRFNYAWTIDKLDAAESQLCFFDMANAPLRLLSERAGALFFLRGDVAEAADSFPVYLDRDFLDRPGHPRWAPQWIARLGLIGKTGNVFDAARLPKGARALIHMRQEEVSSAIPAVGAGTAEEMFDALLRKKILAADEYDPAEQRFRSSTKELTLRRNEGGFQAVTPRSEGFVGPEGTAFAGAFSRVRLVDGWSSVLVASRDGLSLAESSRILILHLTDCRNTGMRYADDDLNILERYGTPPLLMRRGAADIAVKARPGMKLYACGFDGKRLFEVPVKHDGDELRFRAENFRSGEAVAVYELTVDSP